MDKQPAGSFGLDRKRPASQSTTKINERLGSRYSGAALRPAAQATEENHQARFVCYRVTCLKEVKHANAQFLPRPCSLHPQNPQKSSVFTGDLAAMKTTKCKLCFCDVAETKLKEHCISGSAPFWNSWEGTSCTYHRSFSS